MRKNLFPLAAVIALAVAVPSFAAKKPAPPQANQNQPKKVWTNEDMDQLRAQGLISIVGPEFQETATPAEPVAPTFPVYNSKLDDPAWYAQQAADLQAELAHRQAALVAERTAIAQAADGVTQPGLAMDQPSLGITPDAALAILQAQVDEVQSQLDALSDLARQNDIPPGVLRG